MKFIYIPTSSQIRAYRERLPLNTTMAHDINFNSHAEYELIYEYNEIKSKNSTLPSLKELYNIIGINCSDVFNNGNYTIEGTIPEFTPRDLSRGERVMLYIFLSGFTGREITIIGALDCLDYKHILSLCDYTNKFDKLSIIVFDTTKFNLLGNSELIVMDNIEEVSI